VCFFGLPAKKVKKKYTAKKNALWAEFPPTQSWGLTRPEPTTGRGSLTCPPHFPPAAPGPALAVCGRRAKSPPSQSPSRLSPGRPRAWLPILCALSPRPALNPPRPHNSLFECGPLGTGGADTKQNKDRPPLGKGLRLVRYTSLGDEPTQTPSVCAHQCAHPMHPHDHSCRESLQRSRWHFSFLSRFSSVLLSPHPIPCRRPVRAHRGGPAPPFLRPSYSSSPRALPTILNVFLPLSTAEGTWLSSLQVFSNQNPLASFRSLTWGAVGD